MAYVWIHNLTRKIVMGAEDLVLQMRRFAKEGLVSARQRELFVMGIA